VELDELRSYLAPAGNRWQSRRKVWTKTSGIPTFADLLVLIGKSMSLGATVGTNLSE